MSDLLIEILHLVIPSFFGGLLFDLSTVSLLASKIRLNKASKYEKEIIFPQNFDTRKLLLTKDEILLPSEFKTNVDSIINYVSEINKKSILNNLCNLKYHIVENSPRKKDLGQYLFDRNEIELYQANILKYGNMDEVVIHELLHASSSCFREDERGFSILCGFNQGKKISNKVMTMGEMLNEGYTELLVKKITKNNNYNYALSYEPGMIISQLLELFLDDPKVMEDYYFNHDLNGLINLFIDYIPKEELIKVINVLDEIPRLNNTTFIPYAKIMLSQVKSKLYYYFKNSNPSLDKLTTFKEIIANDDLALKLITKSENHIIK